MGRGVSSSDLAGTKEVVFFFLIRESVHSALSLSLNILREGELTTPYDWIILLGHLSFSQSQTVRV